MTEKKSAERRSFEDSWPGTPADQMLPKKWVGLSASSLISSPWSTVSTFLIALDLLMSFFSPCPPRLIWINALLRWHISVGVHVGFYFPQRHILIHKGVSAYQLKMRQIKWIEIKSCSAYWKDEILSVCCSSEIQLTRRSGPVWDRSQAKRLLK